MRSPSADEQSSPVATCDRSAISSIECFCFRLPIAPEQRFHSDLGASSTFDLLLVRVTTKDGLAGFGEANASLSLDADYAAVKAIIDRQYAPQLIGRNALDITGCWELIYNGRRAAFAAQHGRVFPTLNRKGAGMAALSGIDMALWDLAGKSLGQPVYRLLGGACRDVIPLYGSGGWGDASHIGDELLAYVERTGLQAVKMRAGVQDVSIAASARRILAARKALGTDVALYVDTHGSLDVKSALRLLEAVKEAQLGWIEEPVSVDNRAGLARVAAATPVPIAGGECEFTRFDFLELFKLGAIDIAQPDLGRVGGLTEARRIADLASAYHIPIAPHVWGSPILFNASLHLCAAVTNFKALEYPHAAAPLLRDVIGGMPHVEDGMMRLPAGPGLGVEPDLRVLKRWQVDV